MMEENTLVSAASGEAETLVNTDSEVGLNTEEEKTVAPNGKNPKEGEALLGQGHNHQRGLT